MIVDRNAPLPKFSMLADLYGMKVYGSEVVPPGRVVVLDNALFAHPGFIENLLWRDEIRAIVRRQIKAAIPDLLIPRRERHA